MGLFGGRNPPERERYHIKKYHIPAPPPRIDCWPMIRTLNGHIGRKVSVAGYTGKLNTYGCLGCEHTFAVDDGSNKPFTFHPGEVYTVTVTKERAGIIVTIEMCQEI